MLAWLKSPRGSAAIAAAVVTVSAALWLLPVPWGQGARSGPDPQADARPGSAPGSASPFASAVASLRPQDAASPSPAPLRHGSIAALGPAEPKIAPAGSRNPVAALSPESLSGAPPLATSQPALSGQPSFDVVRVEPNGESVVAGRAGPGSQVALLDGGKVVASAKVDASGQFALLPPRFIEGDHYLTLQSHAPDRSVVVSEQGVAVSVAKGGVAKPMVAVLSPDQPARMLSGGATPTEAQIASLGGPPTRNNAAPLSGMAIQSVEAAQGGQFNAAGVARPGNQCRVYLNGAFLANVTAGKDGRWSVNIAKGMRPGNYTVRADEVETGSGKVVNRAEVPFDYPASAVAGGGRQLLAGAASGRPASPSDVDPAHPARIGPATNGGPAVSKPDQPQATVQIASNSGDRSETGLVTLPDLQTARVIRGDSLWRISRKMLGHGMAYTEIYASNVAQIRDPRLIYPGQIFVVPNRVAD